MSTKTEKKIIKPFTCTNSACSRSFRDQKALIYHLRVHHKKNLPYNCSETSCGRKFNSYCCLKKHELIHKGEKPYECQTCHQTFTQVSNLRRHERVHKGEKPYACSVCEKSFSTSSNLKQHMLVHQTKEDRSKIICEICGNSYYYKASLNKHMRTHLGQTQTKVEEDSERSESSEIEEPVSKKQFIAPTNVVIPNMEMDQLLSNKEAIQSMLSFWDANSREWFNSRMGIEPLIVGPALILPTQILHGGEPLKQQIFKNEEAFHTEPDDFKDSSDSLSHTSKSSKQKVLVGSFSTGQEISMEADQNKSKQAHSLSSNPAFGQGIMIPKPIRPTRIFN